MRQKSGYKLTEIFRYIDGKAINDNNHIKFRFFKNAVTMITTTIFKFCEILFEILINFPKSLMFPFHTNIIFSQRH